jgi:hypothetical protein
MGTNQVEIITENLISALREEEGGNGAACLVLFGGAGAFFPVTAHQRCTLTRFLPYQQFPYKVRLDTLVKVFFFF